MSHSFGNIFALMSEEREFFTLMTGFMKEEKKVGYSALIVGAISLGEAWVNILGGAADAFDIFFLGLGLVASLAGIALIIQKGSSAARD